MIVEHRTFMRVDDRMVISWRPAVLDELVVDDLRDVMLMSVNREINSMIAALGEQSPEVAQVLLHLNHKLDLLTEPDQESQYGPSLVRLNISRSGVAFEWGSKIDVGGAIRISMTLPPENLKLTIQAEVLACDPIDKVRSRIRCRFSPNQETKIQSISDYIEHLELMRDERHRLRAPVDGEEATASVGRYAAEFSTLTDYR